MKKQKEIYTPENEQWGFQSTIETTVPVLSFRNYLAVEIMKTMMNNYPSADLHYDDFAEAVYTLADAMIKESKKVK